MLFCVGQHRCSGFVPRSAVCGWFFDAPSAVGTGGLLSSLGLLLLVLLGLPDQVLVGSSIRAFFSQDKGKYDPPRWYLLLRDGAAPFGPLVDVVVVGVFCCRILEECCFGVVFWVNGDSEERSRKGIPSSPQLGGLASYVVQDDMLLWLVRGSHRWEVLVAAAGL